MCAGRSLRQETLGLSRRRRSVQIAGIDRGCELSER
jgi:hypothetical protein